MATHTKNGRQVSSRRVSSNGAGHDSEGGVGVAEWPTEVAAHPGHYPATFASSSHHRGNAQAELCRKYGINEENLAQRRDFLRLGNEERILLAELAPWARSVAPEVAKAFYDWQFSFAPTREYFEGFADAQQMSLATLRQHLESAQAGYFAEVFEGATANWDVDYFERRLKVGNVHDKIDLPLKWYVGSYSEYQRLVGIFLRNSFKDAEKIAQAERAVSKIFNLDLQAIVDSYLLSTMESMGFNPEIIKAEGDKTEHIVELKRATAAMQEQLTVLGKGDLRTSDFDTLMNDPSLEVWAMGTSVKHLLGFLRSLIADTDALVEAAVEGKLSTRADVSKHEGDFRKIVDGINRTLDAVVAPLKVAATYVDRISKGDIPEKITDAYKGDFNELKNNLNACVEGLGGLVEANAVLHKMSLNDQTQRVEGIYQGVFASVAISVNGVQDRVRNITSTLKDIAKGDLHRLPEFQAIARRSEHDEVVPAIIETMESLTALATDAAMLAAAATRGEFDTRADATKHQGQYRLVVEGINGTLDIVVDKTNWYEGILDAVQFPIHVIDKEMKWVFLNKAFEKLMVDNGTIRSRKDAPGMPCSSANASICKTDNCGLVQLAKGNGETYFDWGAQKCKQESSKLINRKGEHIGFVEVVQDLTSIVRAKDYTQAEVVRLASNLVQISKGDFKLNLKQPDADNFSTEVKAQFKQIDEDLSRAVQSIQSLTTESKALVESATAGKLDARMDASTHSGEYAEIASGINNVLDAILIPIAEEIRVLTLIRGGNLRERVEIACKGDHEKLKNSINGLHEWLTELVDFVTKVAHGDATASIAKASDQDQIHEWLVLMKANIHELFLDTEALAKAAVEGRLATRADVSKHEGSYRSIIEGVNQTLDAVIGPLNVAADYVDKISRGAIPEKISDNYNGDFNVIKVNLNNCIDHIDALVSDAGLLVTAAVEGKLSTRADASKHEGDFRKIVEGVNQTLDAVIVPLNVAADYVDKISKGDIPKKITEEYRGDFNEIKDNLNACIDGLGGLAEANAVLHKMAENDYTQKVEGTYQGIFATVATSVNSVQDRVIHIKDIVIDIANGSLERLPDCRKVGRRSENDELMPSMISVMENIHLLIEDTGMLAKAAVEGRIGTRADASKHFGEYRTIIEGVNQTLEAVAGPLKATAENASTLASSSEELTAVSQQMAGNAEETAVQANIVSAASEQVSRNVASVATATEEMQASIREIAKNANDSAHVAKNAVVVAQSTNETMKKLGESSQEIGNVIKVITSIAQQTNLLALNATIEAARAGEAGKGFAVVANEVKELAKQTAKATEEISQKIEAIQGVTKGAVAAIEEIGTIINQINDISNSIASAVEEQTVTTNEIGRSVTEAAQGVNDIAKNISGVATAAKNTTQGANDTKTASLELSEMAARLQASVSKFTF